ncbi:(2Fe-2S) ferredoxin domain-containing protein [Neisseriaceae bacterium JH1-16]|nr:(2Fe-2S) ferredoxin domain-containing protein [Neisseriaceae bacterium JH1-16]
MSFFENHVFVCCNQRAPGEGCCADFGSAEMLGHLKDRVKALGLNGPGKTRVSKAGCLGRCDDGPVLVVYPQGTWYTFVDKDDIDEIIDEHLVNGREVERLKV